MIRIPFSRISSSILPSIPEPKLAHSLVKCWAHLISLAMNIIMTCSTAKVNSAKYHNFSNPPKCLSAKIPAIRYQPTQFYAMHHYSDNTDRIQVHCHLKVRMTRGANSWAYKARGILFKIDKSFMFSFVQLRKALLGPKHLVTVEHFYSGHHWDPAGCPVYSGTSL